MRIIAGQFGGRRLVAPLHGSRPTTDRTREAIFNLVAARMDIRGLQVLDLFAGSGALGLEALSRGAEHATFVETGGEALRTIRTNAADLGVVDQITILRMDAFRFLERNAATYDLAFADPPYDLPGIEQLPDLVLPRLESSPPALFVLEHDARHDFENHDALVTARIYGGTGVSVFGIRNA